MKATAAESQTSALLSVQSLSFHYEHKAPGSRSQALNDVSFNVQRGEFHALLGPNGAGKTTLFALITRLFKTQRGNILLQGSSLGQAPSGILQNIGMVFQQPTLDLDLSVAENLYYHAALQGMNADLAKQRIHQELERVEMGDRLQTRIRQLNMGHRRRVEIARALLHRPQLLLLDEATVGLDSRARADIQRHIRKLCQLKEIGALWATHLIEEIQSNDPVTLLHRGQVLEAGTSAELVSRSGQKDLVRTFEHLTESSAPSNFKAR